jgi:hypothetical protein
MGTSMGVFNIYVAPQLEYKKPYSFTFSKDAGVTQQSEIYLIFHTYVFNIWELMLYIQPDINIRQLTSQGKALFFYA